MLSWSASGVPTCALPIAMWVLSAVVSLSTMVAMPAGLAITALEGLDKRKAKVSSASVRSEERRVGKEGRAGRSGANSKKKLVTMTSLAEEELKEAVRSYR